MIIKTEEFKKVCSTVLAAADSSEISALTETLELLADDKVLYLNVTNKEYYASIKFNLDHEEDFHATVNANLFLKLIAQITTEDIELNIMDNYVELKANGVYKLPLIFDNDRLMELPTITLDNKTAEMNISSDILESILDYNSKELLKGTIAKPVQRMYYIDEFGCITFTSGACVNSFNLEKPIKLLLTNKIVKLFKLFKNDSSVKFSLGYDTISDDILQAKVKFENEKVELTAIIPTDNSLLSSVPVNAIRNRANTMYDFNVTINREALLQAINRLLLFSAGYGSKATLKPYSTFNFDQDKVTLLDSSKENIEIMKYYNNSNISQTYSMLLDLADFKIILDGCSEEYITLSFGNHQAVVLTRNNIKNVIPECMDVSK